MLKSAGVLIALTFTFILLTGDHATADLTCSSSTTLQALATCFRNQMPQSGSNGFVAPDATEQANWRAVVNLMLQGACNFALPASLAGIMQIGLFSDSGAATAYSWRCAMQTAMDLSIAVGERLSFTARHPES